MTPSVALIVWLVLLLALLWFDPAKAPGTSPAIWVPVIWMFIVGTRLPSQWLGGQLVQAVKSLEEGNPLDRAVFVVLILLAIGILVSRSFNWGGFFARNLTLTAFLAFALFSVLWSDFPFVALKRWFRDLGNYLVILVALSDPQPLEAIRTLLRRLGYVLISLSVLLVKYYLQIGRAYDYSGHPMYVGPTTGKNLLGVVGLLGALFFFWDTVARWSDHKERRTRRIIQVNCVFLAMSLWVVKVASSATSQVCLLIGCLVIVAVHSKVFRRQPALLKVLVPGIFCLYLILAYGLGLSGVLAGAVGKDPTLTDRTHIWAFLLHMHINPLIGTGYESFWMGSRLLTFWQNSGEGRINEAHNGFLEVYLNLGIVGVLLLSGFVVASYRTICRRLKPFSSLASLTLAVWIVILFYSVTEAAFRSGLMWSMFLLATLAVPGHAEDREHNLVASGKAGDTKDLPDLPLEAKGQWR